MKARLSRLGATTAALLITTSMMTACKSSQADDSYQITSVQKGNFSVAASQQDIDSGKVFEDECPGRVCACQADIDRVQLTGTDSISSKINLALDKIVPPKCNATLQATGSTSQVTFVSPQLVSVVSDQLVLGQGANGGCNGQTVALTFDRTNGAELKLKDVVDGKDLPAIAKLLAKEITDNQRKQSPELFTPETEVASKIAAKNGDLGLFLQAGKVMVQVDNFLYSCAEGHSFPAALPVQYIRNDRLRAAVGSGTNP